MVNTKNDKLWFYAREMRQRAKRRKRPIVGMTRARAERKWSIGVRHKRTHNTELKYIWCISLLMAKIDPIFCVRTMFASTDTANAPPKIGSISIVFVCDRFSYFRLSLDEEYWFCCFYFYYCCVLWVRYTRTSNARRGVNVARVDLS